jgi:tetratricopeptide (TPR) repeat protein
MEAIRIKPDYYEAHYSLGNALYAAGDIKCAVETYENFIKYAPPEKYAQLVEQVNQLIRELKGKEKS